MTPKHAAFTGLALFCPAVLAAQSTAEPTDMQALEQQLQELMKQNELQRKQIILLKQRIDQQKQIADIDKKNDRKKTAQASDELGEKPQSSDERDVLYENATQFFGSNRLTIEPSITYSQTSSNQLVLNGFLALDSIFLGQINVDKIRSEVWTFNLATRYAFGDWQVDLNLPYLYRHTRFQSGGAGGASTSLSEANIFESGHVGDMSLGLSYRWVKEDQIWPDIVTSLRIKGPSGRAPYGIKTEEVVDSSGNLNVPSQLPTGNGIWSGTVGLSVAKSVDPAVLYAGVNYTFNRSAHFDDISSTENQLQPARVDLGDSYDIYLGTAFALNNRMSLGLGYSTLISKRSRIREDGGDYQYLVGSQVNASRLNLNLSYTGDNSLSYLYSLGIGLTEDSPDAVLSLRVPIGF